MSTSEAFQDLVTASFRKSGVSHWLESNGLQFVTDTAADPYSDAVFPVAEFLNWDAEKFSKWKKRADEALLMYNEDSTPWQAILNIPRKEKPYWYLAPREMGNRAFLPHVPKAARQAIAKRYSLDAKELTTAKSFWDWVQFHPEIPIILTEGAKKGFALLQLGYVAIALYGCNCLESSSLDAFLPGRKVTIAMDCDSTLKTKFKVEKAVIKGAKILGAKGAKKISIATWDTTLGKGVDDVLATQGIPAVEEIMANPISRTAYQQQHNEAIKTTPPKEAIAINLGRSATKKYWDTLEAEWGDRLRWNEMTLRVEKDGQDYDLELAFLDVAKEMDVDISSRTAELIVKALARQNPYHPFREYLKALTGKPGIDLNNLATRYLGNDLPLANIMLKKTLISAVRRAFEPGCQVDTVCILQGKTGYRKSTFWATLASPQFFCDNLSEGNRKDEKLKLSRYAIIEYAEIETVWKQKDVSEMKSFLSSKIDAIRPPYGRNIEDIPRTSIFVGTTNKQEFLSDPTGERRYWVIEVNQRIDIDTLKKERDQIWAEAVRLCLDDEIHHLTPEEDIELEKSNKDFKTSDTWEDVINEYINAHQLQEITVRELLTKALNLEEKDQRRVEQMRCADILQTGGWIKSHRRNVDGKKTQVWQRELNNKKGMSGMSGMSTNTENLSPVMLSGFQNLDIPQTYPPESSQGTSNHHSSPQSDIPNGQSIKKIEVRPPSSPDSTKTSALADIPDIPISTLEKLHTVLTQEQQKQLSPKELTKHFEWQVSQLVKLAPRDQIFQDLIPVVSDGALKAALLKTQNKTGAKARAIDNELEKRHPLVTTRR